MKKKKLSGKALYDEKKKELNESIEYLRQVDAPESMGGGRKYVVDTRKEEKKEEKKSQDNLKSYLEIRRQARYGYRERLATYAFERMVQQNFPLEWEYYCIPTDGRNMMIFGKGFKTKEGILFIIKSPKGDVYVRGVALVHDPEYDVNAVNIMVIQVENTIDSARGFLLSDNKDTASTMKKTKGGIYVPD